MRQTIITLTKDGTAKNNGFGKHGAHFMPPMNNTPTIPSFWEEPTFTVEKTVVDHDFPLKGTNKKRQGIRLQKILAEKLHLTSRRNLATVHKAILGK